MPLSATPTMQRMNDDRIRFARIEPSVDGGKFPVKRLQGELLHVKATIFRDGSDVLGAAVRYHHEVEREYHHQPLKHLGNDLWQGSFHLETLGTYQFSVVAWTDAFATWQQHVQRKWAAGDQDLGVEFQEGAALIRALADLVPRTGPLNMALDELLLEFAAAEHTPVLRTYRWSKPFVSIGYFDRIEAIEEQFPGRPGVR